MKKHLSQLNRFENKLLSSLRKHANGKFLSAFALFLLMGATTFAQTAYITAPPSNGTSNLNRAPNGSVDFQRTAAIYRGSELVGFPSGQSITSIGFSIATPAAAAAIGTIKIYMVNTTDATFTRSTTWADLISTPTAMALVYDGPLTIPAAAGFYDIALTTPFAYTGGNFYLAYEWNAITKSAASAIYNANADLAASLRTEVGTTAPATLTQSSAFRPVLRIGYTPPPIDAEVKAIFTMGKLAVSSGSPHAVQAVIRNAGSSPLTAITVSLNVVGVNTFSNTKTVTIPPQTDTLVTFDPYTPTATGNNNITVSVSVPGDASASNDTRTSSQQVTANTMGYADYSATPITVTHVITPINAAGNASEGKLVVKLHTANEVTVNAVKVYIPDFGTDPRNAAGRTVHAIVLNSAGVEVGRSANLVITAADQEKFTTFTITTPPTFDNEEFYVGIAVPATTPPAVFFPAAGQAGSAVRTGSFFNSPTVASTTLTDRNANIVPLIEADLASVIIGTKEDLVNNAVAVYPNPSNGNFRIQFSNELNDASAKSVEIRNINGQLVYNGTATASAEAMNVSVKNLAAGVYILQVKSDTQLAVKRLVIE